LSVDRQARDPRRAWPERLHDLGELRQRGPEVDTTAGYQLVVSEGSPAAVGSRLGSDDEPPTVQILCGMLDHELPHAGELSLLLGADGLLGAEI